MHWSSMLKRSNGNLQDTVDPRMYTAFDALSYDYSGTSIPSETLRRMHWSDLLNARKGKVDLTPSASNLLPVRAKAMKLEATSKAFVDTLCSHFQKST
jgi:hypothetical protein